MIKDGGSQGETADENRSNYFKVVVALKEKCVCVCMCVCVSACVCVCMSMLLHVYVHAQ